jgi:hypothetical protein
MPAPMINLTNDPQFAAAVAPIAPAPAAPVVPTVSPAVVTPSTTAATSAPLTTSPSAPALTTLSPRPAAASAPKPTTFGEKLHAALMRNPLQPGGILKNVAIAGIDAVGGITNVLANVAAPPDSAIGIAAQTARNIQASRQATADAAAKAKQQAFENQMRSNEDQRSQQMLNSDLDLNKAKMFEAHAAAINTLRIARQESDEFHAQMQQSANTLAQPYEEAGGEVLAHDIPESEKLNWMQQHAPRDPKTGRPDPTQYISFQDGEIPVMDPKTGQQMLSPDGTPAYQRTYQIIKIGPRVELTRGQVAILNQYAPPNQGQWETGQKLDGQSYALLAKRAQLAETVALNVQKTQSEINKNLSDAKKARADANLANQTAAQKAQNLRTANLFAPYLGIAGGDPVLALDYMKRSKDAKSVPLVEQMYGPGTIEKTRQANLTALAKTIEDDQKQLNDPVASAQMSDDDKTELQNELKAARAQRNQYLGLHPNDPDQITQSVLRLDTLDPSKRSQAILGSTTTPNAAKIYLLRHYGLPVPPALLPQPKPAAQPAAQ